jgi:hypothetical protein
MSWCARSGLPDGVALLRQLFHPRLATRFTPRIYAQIDTHDRTEFWWSFPLRLLTQDP